MKKKAPKFSVIKRLGRILWSLLYHFPKIVSGPKYCALVVEDLGGGIIKLAQILAMRYDLLPERYCLELSRLFDNVKPMSRDEMVLILEQELGKKPEQVFSDFSYEVYASASFGQVHRATYKNIPVAVKIQRPEVGVLARADIAVIKFLAGLADSIFWAPVSIREVIREWESWTLFELDYKKELANTQRIKEESQNNPYVYVPRVFPEISTERILVSEFLEGRNLNTLIREKVDLPPETRKHISRSLVRGELWQYFNGYLYHANPHPGNVILMPDGRLGYVDFGIMGKTEDHYQIYHFANFMRLASLKEIKEAVAHLKEMMHSTLAVPVNMIPAKLSWHNKSHQEIERGMKRFLEEKLGRVITRWAEHAGDVAESLYERSSARHFLVLLAEARSFGLEIPTNLLAFVRAVVIVDMICLVTYPEFNMREELQMFFQDHPDCTRLPETAPGWGLSKEASMSLERGENLAEDMEWERELNQRMLERYLDHAGRIMERILEEGSGALAYFSTKEVSILRDLM